MADEKMLNRMGATAQDPPDPMLVKWLEEREKRCTAEAACNLAWRHLEAAQESKERWRKLAWRFGIAAALCLPPAIEWIILLCRRLK